MSTVTRTWLPIPLTVKARVCPICGADQFAVLLKHESFGFPLRTVECSRCGLLYANPRPTSEFLAQFYCTTYRRFYEGKQQIAEPYIRRHRLRQLAEMRVQRYRAFLGPGVRIMDVGCGLGLFLSEVRRRCRGSHVQGVEPEPDSAEYCASGLRIRVDRHFLEQVPVSLTFDILSAFHVLEHVSEFDGFFLAVQRHLRPGGLMLVEAPNALGSWDGIGMFHLAHLQTFSIRTLSNLLGKYGFEIMEAGPIEAEIDPSNLFVVARLTGRPSQFVAQDPDQSEQIREKVAHIRSARTVRIGRCWAKLALSAMDW